MTEEWFVTCFICKRLPKHAVAGGVHHLYACCNTDVEGCFHHIVCYGETEQEARKKWNKVNSTGIPVHVQAKIGE